MSDPFDLNTAPEPQSAPAQQEPPYLQALNESQREAVLALDGPVLVLAGAGTGKTRVLTTRMAHILHTGRAWPSQILSVTFTNKAAREMQHRVADLIGQAVEGMPWLGTFHSVSARILRRHAELVGLRSNYTILDTDDQIRLLKQLIRAENIDDKRWPARALASLIDGWKNRGLTPDKIPEGDAELFANGKAGTLYKAYQERLIALNAADFGDLLLHCVTIFMEHPEVLAEYHDRFKYILVDEYQDTNVAQYLWLRLLAQKQHNICCVGDDDQSIYGWRGAEVGNILRFEQDFPGARIVRLERNYRSTPHILGAASGLISANETRLGKTLWTDVNSGERVMVRGIWDGPEEARIAGETIEQLHQEGAPYSQMAILVRASFQTREFEERLVTIGVPYRVIGGPKFYNRAEIRDANAYLKLVQEPSFDLAFERIVNQPKRGLGDAAQSAMHQIARDRGIPLTAAAKLLADSDELRPKARTALRELLESLTRWRQLLDEMPHPEVAEIILDESGYTAMWQNDRSPDAPGKLDNLGELIRAMEPFENLQEFMEHVSLATEAGETQGGDDVSLMTLHAAKGLEFDVVFLPGWEEGLFPHQRALDEGGNAALEEERRLAYVGLTRARKRAFISAAANRRIYNQWQSSLPSRFLDELPEEHIERETASGLYQGGRGTGYESEDYVRRGNGGTGGGAHSGTGGGTHGGSGAFRSPRQKIIDAKADRVVVGEPSSSAYAVGQRIFHQKFGYGRIADVSGNKLEIKFDKAGTKRVIDSFVEPAS